jgi:alpha-tubulin suppressor-like RCC1 family protein
MISDFCMASLRDSIKPVVSAFTIPLLHNKLTIPISTFTATDNIGINGYLITTTATVPSASDANWSPTLPSTFTFPPTTLSGDYILYAWVKDAGDNISTTISAPTKLDLDVPTISAFTIAPYINGLVVPVTSFTATDNYGGVTGYMVTESSVPPLADDKGWIPPVQSIPSGVYSAPTFSKTYTDIGSKALYAWVKDAAGNVSAPATAVFDFCTVTASSDANGTITLPGLSTYYCSQNRLYKFAPKPGFKIADVLVDGVSVGNVSNYLFPSMSAPGSQHTVSATFEPDSFANWHQVAPGYLHTLAVRADGTMWAWGDNAASQLGDGTTTSRYNPIRVTTYSDWQTAAAGPYHSMARRSNACLYGWGDNTSKQLGGSGSTLPVMLFCGSGSTSTTPQGGTVVAAPVVDVYTAGKVASSPVTSTSYSLMRKTDGKFSYMGASPADSSTNSMLIDWVELAAGVSHSVAIRADGTIWSWGDNTKGQLGSTVIFTPNPALPQPTAPPATNWIQVAAGNAHTVGLQANGTLWSWGDNSRGQMGTDLIPSYYPKPFQIGKGQSWKAIAAGDNHTLALRSDGTIWAFGDNSNGQLGDGSGATTNFPVQVGTDSDWKSISAHGDLSYGIKNNNTLYAWGANSKGQLGDTTTVDKLSPVLVGTNTNSFVIAATSSNGGSISPSGVITAAAGTSKTFSIAPLVGWHIDDVVVDGISQGRITSHIFSNVIDRHTIAVTFAPDTTASHTITATAGIGASVSPNGTVVVINNNSQLFTISPQTGYQISDVVVDGISQGAIPTFVFPSVTSIHTIQVSAVMLDTTVPTGAISINGSATSTTSNIVTLSLSATDAGGNLYQMRFSLDNVTWSAFELYATSKNYTLPAGDGTKNLYVQFCDKAGNISSVYHGDIILDTLIPAGSVTLNNGSPSTTTVSITANLNATDGGSGVGQMQVSWDGITWQPWEIYASTKSVTARAGNGAKTLYVRFKDLAGNVSDVTSASIMLASSGSVVAKPGDCDNNGTVTIGEVQSAINMFLGLKTVETCVDTNGAEGVSIAEVQKTINSFLGL